MECNKITFLNETKTWNYINIMSLTKQFRKDLNRNVKWCQLVRNIHKNRCFCLDKPLPKISLWTFYRQSVISSEVDANKDKMLVKTRQVPFTWIKSKELPLVDSFIIKTRATIFFKYKIISWSDGKFLQCIAVCLTNTSHCCFHFSFETLSS